MMKYRQVLSGMALCVITRVCHFMKRNRCHFGHRFRDGIGRKAGKQGDKRFENMYLQICTYLKTLIPVLIDLSSALR